MGTWVLIIQIIIGRYHGVAIESVNNFKTRVDCLHAASAVHEEFERDTKVKTVCVDLGQPKEAMTDQLLKERTRK
jgi:hypothetical protein